MFRFSKLFFNFLVLLIFFSHGTFGQVVAVPTLERTLQKSLRSVFQAPTNKLISQLRINIPSKVVLGTFPDVKSYEKIAKPVKLNEDVVNKSIESIYFAKSSPKEISLKFINYLPRIVVSHGVNLETPKLNIALDYYREILTENLYTPLENVEDWARVMGVATDLALLGQSTDGELLLKTAKVYSSSEELFPSTIVLISRNLIYLQDYKHLTELAKFNEKNGEFLYSWWNYVKGYAEKIGQEIPTDFPETFGTSTFEIMYRKELSTWQQYNVLSEKDFSIKGIASWIEKVTKKENTTAKPLALPTDCTVLAENFLNIADRSFDSLLPTLKADAVSRLLKEIDEVPPLTNMPMMMRRFEKIKEVISTESNKYPRSFEVFDKEVINYVRGCEQGRFLFEILKQKGLVSDCIISIEKPFALYEQMHVKDSLGNDHTRSIVTNPEIRKTIFVLMNVINNVKYVRKNFFESRRGMFTDASAPVFSQVDSPRRTYYSTTGNNTLQLTNDFLDKLSTIIEDIFSYWSGMGRAYGWFSGPFFTRWNIDVNGDIHREVEIYLPEYEATPLDVSSKADILETITELKSLLLSDFSINAYRNALQTTLEVGSLRAEHFESAAFRLTPHEIKNPSHVHVEFVLHTQEKINISIPVHYSEKFLNESFLGKSDTCLDLFSPTASSDSKQILKLLLKNK